MAGSVVAVVALGACSSDDTTPASSVPATNEAPSTAVRVTVTVAAPTTTSGAAATPAPTLGAINGPAAVDMTSPP